MMKKHFLATTLISTAMLGLMSVSAWAANGISINVTGETTVDKGTEVTLTVTSTADKEIYGGVYTVLVNGKDISGEIDLDSVDEGTTITTGPYKFVADEVGDYTITLTDPVQLVVLNDDGETEYVTVSAAPVKITAKEPHVHSFSDPTCTEPGKCECGETSGEALGHDFGDNAEKCSRCGEANPDYKAPTTEAPTTEAPTTQAPTTEAPTQAPTVAVTLDSIRVSYVGGPKKAGEALLGSDALVEGVFSDGHTEALSGWGCTNYYDPMVEGDNVYEFVYNGLKASMVVKAEKNENESASATTTEAEETSEDETTSEEETTTEGNAGVPYIQVVSPFGKDDLYLATDWDVDAPDNFEETTVKYSNYDVKAVKNENGLILVYMTDAKGENGDFYIFDEDTSKFSLNIPIPSSDAKFYLLTFPDDFDTEGKTKMSLSLDGTNYITAYQIVADKENASDVCLVYATNDKGEKGYYRFDTKLLTFVRYYADNVSAPEADNTTASGESTTANGNDPAVIDKYNSLATKYNNDMQMRLYIIIALIVLAVILFIFVIVLAMKLKRLYDEYDFEDDEDDDEDDDDEEDDDEDDEDDDDDDDDDEDDDEEDDDEEEDDEKYGDDDFRVDLSGIEDEE